jgi:hypothetical protein
MGILSPPSQGQQQHEQSCGWVVSTQALKCAEGERSAEKKRTRREAELEDELAETQMALQEVSRANHVARLCDKFCTFLFLSFALNILQDSKYSAFSLCVVLVFSLNMGGVGGLR